jgi:peptidoglycan-associated lipoprotein
MPIRSFFAVLLRTVMLTVVAMTLSLAAAAQSVPKAEASFEYNYVHANAPPTGCGCFSMMGGSASLGLNVHGGLAAVAEFSAGHASNVAPTGEDLMLTSYLFGPRYTYRTKLRIAPFGEALAGFSHASGALAPSNSFSGASSNTFATAIGGGLDYNVSHAVVIRIVQADYFLTTFQNEADHHQNNLRLGAGIAFRFGQAGPVR